MSVVQKLRKRRAYPVAIAGETVMIRSLLNSEFDAIMEFRDENESIGAAIGYGLLNDDESPAFTLATGENAKTFGARVLTELDVPLDTRKELSDKILKLTVEGPSVEKLEKN